MKALLGCLVVAGVVVTGCNCGDGPTGEPDGSVGAVDSGATVRDAGGVADAGASTVDAGGAHDAGPNTDAGEAVHDAGGPLDSGVADAGTGPRFDDAGCPVLSGVVSDAAAAGFPPAGLVLWLRSDLGVDAFADGGVCRWEDVSGNGHHFVPLTPTNLPALIAQGINSHPSVFFGGYAPGLLRNDVLGLDAGSGRTFAIITQMFDTTNRFHTVFQGVPNTPGTYFGFDQNTFATSGSKEGVYVTNNAYDAVAGTTNTVRTHVLSISTFEPGAALPAALVYSVDGTVQTLSRTPAGFGTNTVEAFDQASFTTIGSGDTAAFGGGWIGDVLVYDHALSTVERQQVETALHTRYPQP